eukprot:9246605-Prorocentrum_lima.AAC.1
MTSSLVGSEMCIRDSRRTVQTAGTTTYRRTSQPSRSFKSALAHPMPAPVSYTHLTLPTICSV